MRPIALFLLLGLGACSSSRVDSQPTVARDALAPVRAVPELAARLRAMRGPGPALSLRLPETAASAMRLSRTDRAFHVDVVAEGRVAVPGRIVDGATTFGDVAAETDAVYQAGGAALEDLTILRGSAAPHRLSFRLVFGDEVASARVRDGSIELVDIEGRVGLSTDPLVAIDANGTRRTLAVALEPASHGARFVVEVPRDLVYPIVVDPYWTTVASMKAVRHEHSHVVLANGDVLVIGGRGLNGATLLSAEIYSVDNNTWTLTAAPPAGFARRATTIRSGNKVLVLGPQSAVYDVTANSWTLSAAYGWGAPALLADGRVFISDNDVWNPTTNAIAKVAMPARRRDFPIAIPLANNRVLVAGGSLLGSAEFLSTADVYDVTANTWSVGPSLNSARYRAAVVQSSAGTWVTMGGYGGLGEATTTEILDSTTLTWTELNEGSSGYGGMFAALPGNRILADRLPSQFVPKVLDVAAKTWTTVPIGTDRSYAATAPISLGRVLVAGGQHNILHEVLSTVEIFDLGSNGEPCLGGAACKAGNCVQGICCDTTCTGACVACTTGTCTNVNGTPPATRAGCSRFLCVSGTCGTSCSTNAQCDAASWCSSPTCVPRKPDGEACTDGAQCTSSVCVDGVCCNSACTEQCAACDVAGFVGTCTATKGAPHGSRASCVGVGAGTDCARRCDGTNKTACSYPSTTSPCGAYGCAASTETHVSTCDGAGRCQDVPTGCGAYGCGTTACKSICATSSDCAAGHWCAAGACVAVEGLGKPCDAASSCATGFCVDGVCCGATCGPGSGCAAPGKAGTCMKNAGSACVASAECGTNHCVDGVCCDTACDGVCEACDAPGHFGTCFPVKGPPHGARPACKSDPAAPCADETCDGVATKTCAARAGADVRCRPASCAAGAVVPAATCDGKGACPAATSASCGGFQCDVASNSCRSSCRDAKDCLDGFDCKDDKCAPKSASCSKDLLSVLAVDGTTTSCSPYICRGGACVTVCSSSNECIAGRVCDASSKTCVDLPAAEPESSGCTASRRSSSSGLLLFALAAVAMIARRRHVALALAASLGGCSERAPEKPANVRSDAESTLSIVRAHGLARRPTETSGPLSVTLPDRADAATVLRDGDATLTIEPLDLAPIEGRMIDGAQVFTSAFAGGDVVHVASPARFEDVRLLRSERAPATARYRLRTKLELRRRGSIVEAVDGAGRVRFAAEPPFAVDAAGVERAVDVELAREGDDRILVTHLDVRGLKLPIAIDPAWTTGAPMNTPRHQHWMITLSNGKVLASGGRIGNGTFIDKPEVYDPTTNTWTATSDPPTGMGADAIPLPDARAISIGGGQIYDAKTNVWSTMTQPPSSAGNTAAVALSATKVLVAAGQNASQPSLETWVGDLANGTWTRVGDVAAPRTGGAAHLRTNGEVILLSGVPYFGIPVPVEIELWSPTSKLWTTIGSAPANSVVTRLDDTRIAAFVSSGFSGPYLPMKIFDIVSKSWTDGPTQIGNAQDSFVQLTDGTLFVRAFDDSAGPRFFTMLFDAGAWVDAGPWPSNLTQSRIAAAGGNRLIIAGGADSVRVYGTTLVWQRQANGGACVRAAECVSKLCVDGVCCNSICTAPCQACNVSGSIGTCSAVTGPPVGTRSCAPYLSCNAGSCASSCAVDADCSTGQWCDATNKCSAKGALAAACTTPRGCTSGFCADGVCCNSACGAQCAACDVPTLVGTCSPVAGPPHGARAACEGFGAGTTCGIRCDGADIVGCHYPAATTACGSAACASAIETHTAVCNGLGLCADVAKSCGAYGCGATTCKTSCTATSDCAAGFHCSTGACTPVAGLGKTCSTDDACATGHCVDGVCCGAASCATGATCASPSRRGTCAKANGTTCANDAECGAGVCADGVCCESRCAGQCQACDVPGQLGLCAPVTGGPHAGRALCPKDEADPCKGSSCDGKDTTKCAALAGTDIACRAPSCDKGVATAAASCNSTGTCPALVTSSCDGYACDTATKACRTTCSAAADCETAYVCKSSKCVPAAAACSDDALSVVSVDGTSAPCTPFVCREGACLAECASSADCVSGALCDPSTRTCGAASLPIGDEGGGCSTIRSDARFPWLALLALGAAVARARGFRGRVIRTSSATTRR